MPADEATPDTPDELRRMARQYVESLRAAGVEWIERPPPPAQAGPKRPARPQPTPAAPFEPPQPAAPADLFAPPAAPTLPRPQKIAALKLLDDREVIGCPKCKELAATRTQTVFGVGNPEAELMFVGEAPGADEDAQGEPFVGAAGQLLNRILAACKLARTDVYIANILKCRPPGNRTPLPNEVANCLPYLERQIEIIRPRFLCALGSVAAQNLLKTTQSIGKLRGRFHDYQGIPVLCTYHPAYLLRNPAAKRDVWDDMKKLMARMGRPVD